MQNGHPKIGSLIQRSASSMFQLGSNTFGSVLAEFEQKTRWLADDRVRRQSSGKSDYSYEEVGDDRWPVRIFTIGSRSSSDNQALMPWLRTHIELSLAILETKKIRPRDQITYQLDEFRQYGQINAIRNGATTLREAGVRLWIQAQSWASLIEVLGQAGADELEACSALEFFGTDANTAEKVSRMLGKHGLSDRPYATGSDSFHDVVTPAEVMHELRKGSPLKYVFPTTMGPLRLRRMAYKPVVTEEGIRYAGLPLEGHYDEHLSKYRYGNRST
jgi:type IV secretory pathway TraG/TraD family ATPase VirD4